MFIRNQHKSLIIDISNKCVFVKDGAICVSTFTDNSVTLGKYASKERAIAVLDEICKALDLSVCLDPKNMDLGADVFDMPTS